MEEILHASSVFHKLLDVLIQGDFPPASLPDLSICFGRITKCYPNDPMACLWSGLSAKRRRCPRLFTFTDFIRASVPSHRDGIFPTTSR